MEYYLDEFHVSSRHLSFTFLSFLTEVDFSDFLLPITIVVSLTTPTPPQTNFHSLCFLFRTSSDDKNDVMLKCNCNSGHDRFLPHLFQFIIHTKLCCNIQYQQHTVLDIHKRLNPPHIVYVLGIFVSVILHSTNRVVC